MSMIRRKPLGNTKVTIPEIGLGTWKYSGGVDPLRLGIWLGADLIDTAEIYGTEGVVGEAIEGIRDKVFLATKVSPQHFSYNDVIKAAEASLKRLRVDKIDLYQLHWPSQSVPIKETMKAMQELVDRGKIRYIGVSNFSVDQTQEAREALSYADVVSNQVEYSPAERSIEDDILPYCEKEGITVIAYTPLARGRLGHEHSKFLDELAKKYQKTREQIILNWVTSRDNVVAIPKADRVDHVRDNCAASGWRLSNEDIKPFNEEFS
jgi:diketogulonate reductase-like aldo/keto reductase